jgi:hypothetical protein
MRLQQSQRDDIANAITFTFGDGHAESISRADRASAGACMHEDPERSV